MSVFPMSGLRPDQGPPLPVPVSLFAAGGLGLVAAGVLLLSSPARSFESVWAGPVVALVHLGTLGLLGAVMLGALYQMLPVVAGAVVPAPRLAFGVAGLLAAGTACLAYGQATAWPLAFRVADGLLAAALLLFLVPAGLALARSRATGATVWGLRLSLLGLLSVGALGVVLAWVRGGGGYGEAWLTWRYAHAHLGLLAWIGCLTASVLWQVLPMFFLSPAFPRWAGPAVLGPTLASLVALWALFFLRSPLSAVVWAAAPGALALWLLQPLLVARALWTRRRKRADPSLRYFWLSQGCAVAGLLLGLLCALWDDARLPLLYGWVLLWGWAAALVHGMITKIVPFLLFFHRLAALVGLKPVPSMRELYPDGGMTLGFVLHAAALLAGVVAGASSSPWAWRGCGALLVATALHVAVRLWRAFRLTRAAAS